MIVIGQTTIKVEGNDADEVARVSRQLAADQREADRRAAAQLRSPWLTGTFYLFVVVVIAAVFVAVAKLLPYWSLPVIAIGSLLGVTIIGALQLRHDDRLGERNFVELMGMTLKRLPLLAGKPPSRSEA